MPNSPQTADIAQGSRECCAGLLSGRAISWALGVAIALVSYLTILRQYEAPASFFWDENYHIASAQKYLNGVFFMEPHPPLGKLLIAAGELLLDASPRDDQFINTDHAQGFPEGFSLKGYRFIPALLSAIAPLVFYIFLLELTASPLTAALFALMIPLDNAMVVHFRGAMLDGMQLMFVCVALAAAARIYRRLRIGASPGVATYLGGLSLGAAISTKATALIISPFIVILVLLAGSGEMRARLMALARIALCAAAISLLIWGIHIRLGSRVNTTLPDGGFYQASERSKEILKSGSQARLSSFAPLLIDHLRFFPHYERGVPKPNMCNPNENGSHPLIWPLGARAINYRWHKDSGGGISYTYLVANPVVWGTGLVGLLVGVSFLIASFLGGYRVDREWRLLAGALVFMWLGYMAVMLSLDRVMYLYHYFLPLVFSLALCAVTLNGERLAILRGSKLACGAAAVVLSLGTLLGFRAYAPLTYGHPISDQKIASLALLKLWDLRCPSCELTNTIAKPVCNPKEFRFPRIRIGQVQASEAFQDWGEPVQDLSVEKQVVTIKGVKFSEVIGTHANSTIRFSIANKGYTSLTGRVGLPDYVSSKSGTAASVTFQVWLDGKMLWQSNRITPQDQLQEFSLSVAGGSQLELRTLDSGDGNNNDHAVWVEPRLM